MKVRRSGIVPRLEVDLRLLKLAAQVVMGPSDLNQKGWDTEGVTSGAAPLCWWSVECPQRIKMKAQQKMAEYGDHEGPWRKNS